MNDILEPVRKIVSEHKALSTPEVTKAAREAFERIKDDIASIELTTSTAMIAHLMFIAGCDYGQRAALDMAKDIFMGRDPHQLKVVE